MSEVVFVGTSDAFGAGGRRQSAVLLRDERGTVLLDCGVTTNTGLGELGIERDEVETILVSHFHGDHFGGLPLFLLAAMYEDERKTPLHIVGPPDVESRVRTLCDAMGHSIRDRDWSYEIRFHEARAGQAFEIGPARLESFETRHQLEAHPHGYRVSAGRAQVVYSGDTGWFDDLPRLAAGADLFVCECTYHSSDLDFHLNYEQLCEERSRFDCGRWILTHLGSQMAHRRGEIELETADDGLRVRL